MSPAIASESRINVLVDPPGPFRYFPDFILQSVGEAALKASLSTLQVGFQIPILCSTKQGTDHTGGCTGKTGSRTAYLRASTSVGSIPSARPCWQAPELSQLE